MADVLSLTLARAFDATREQVFALWTDPTLVAQWWGIAGSTIPVCDLDVRVGGRWRIHMRTAGGKTYPNGGVYLEVVPFERLVYSDEPDPSISEWDGTPPGFSQHTVTFAELGERTMVTLHILFASDADRQRMIGFGMKTGLEQGLDRLNALIAQLAPTDP